MSPTLNDNQILIGPLFNEPMRVETARRNPDGSWETGLVGTRSERFRKVFLSADDLESLTIRETAFSYDGDGTLLSLGLQAYALGIAWELDPYFGLSISRVDPLPHQLEAVYDYLLRLARVRFLLADDAGAGKTIMAGLLIRELKLRGLAERILIVAPANLSFQWQRELSEKFDERFQVVTGGQLRDQYGINQWIEQKKVITSLDLAKRDDILPGLRQVHWDLVIVDEAHRMSARDEAHKSLRYRLGELLRDTSDHLVLLTATPHKGDPVNFSLFLQLLDEDAYADVRSIHEAMSHQRAPFYLRRTKEAMVYFPERNAAGELTKRKIFTKRIPHTVAFSIDGAEDDLYRAVTQFVKNQCRRAAAMGDDPRARAVGFLMALYQRRLASSTRSMRRSLENRANRLERGLEDAQALARTAPPDLPDREDLEEMEDVERERWEQVFEAVTLTRNAEMIRREINELRELSEAAEAVESGGAEAKLGKLRDLLHSEGFFDHPDRRLLIFTEFRDTLDYLVEKLRVWGFTVGSIHGGMKPGSRDERGTRVHTEQRFREGEIQILVATEAAGEGINLQCCNILFNYDIPWNPNRLEQRMGRIHRYGQLKDCLIFNFVATNTMEGHVLRRLLDKLQEIRDALDDDAVFNVVGEVLPAAHVDRVLRDYYAGRYGDADLEEQLLKDVDERRFRDICQNALEGLATKNLNLEMLAERRARARERRLVPETIARFMREAAEFIPFRLKTDDRLPHTFTPARTPNALRRHERDVDWKLPPLANRYPRCSTDRETADTHALEWVTPGHPLFESIRRHTMELAMTPFARGACFHSISHDAPARIDFYRAKVVDGLGHVVHERLFAVELREDADTELREPTTLGNFSPAEVPDALPAIATAPEPSDWLQTNALTPFLEATRADRVSEVARIAEHVELSLTELLQRADDEIGRAAEDVEEGVQGAEGRLTMAESRHDELRARRERRREDLGHQQALSLQGVERLTSVLVLPHPEREASGVTQLRQNRETEAIAMETVMAHERARGRQVEDVSQKNVGYDLTSIDPSSGEIRLIEVKGLSAATGTILLTPNERRVAEDRRDCYWLYIVTHCADSPVLQEPVRDPARYPWNEVKAVRHYYLDVDAMTQPMELRETVPPLGSRR